MQINSNFKVYILLRMCTQAESPEPHRIVSFYHSPHRLTTKTDSFIPKQASLIYGGFYVRISITQTSHINKCLKPLKN